MVQFRLLLALIPRKGDVAKRYGFMPPILINRLLGATLCRGRSPDGHEVPSWGIDSSPVGDWIWCLLGENRAKRVFEGC